MDIDKLSQSAIPPGNRRYFQEPAVADTYDDSLRGNPIAAFDEQLWSQFLDELANQTKDATVIDFGCGTGRSLAAAVSRGFKVIGVDLSMPMLMRAEEKLKVSAGSAAATQQRWLLVQSDLRDLGWLGDNSVDLAGCFFSTLGMIRFRKQRHLFLREVWRVLKPRGSFLVHAHNLWHQARFPGGKRWLILSGLRSLISSSTEFGDRYADQRHVAGLFLHSFTRSALHGELRDAGLTIRATYDIPDVNQQRSPVGWVCHCVKT